jgi:DNA-binding response OmpR family regulator
MKILLIEDEPELRKSVKAFLNDEGYVVESASDFIDARDKIGAYDYDCVLVDVTLPKGSGLDIVKELKSLQPQAGIIIISAKGSLEDKVSGLELGADDYLPKPFHLTELNARIKALFRRKNFDGNEVITIKEIKIFPLKRTAFVHDQPIQLTAKEFDLLLYFVSNKNRVVSKSSVAEHLLGDYAERMDSFDFVYAHIKNMRKKIVEKGGTDYLLNVYGIGYNFNVEQ